MGGLGLKDSNQKESAAGVRSADAESKENLRLRIGRLTPDGYASGQWSNTLLVGPHWKKGQTYDKPRPTLSSVM